MQRKALGNTSLEVSILGFGASPLGDVFARTDPHEGMRAVHSAIDGGINFFDVSPYYGLTLAEERLGAALRGRRNDVVIATKAGRYGTDTFDFSREGIRKGLEGSLSRLHTDHVDLLQAHDIEFGSAEQIIHETVPALRELQNEGKARYIGLTGYPLQLLASVAKAVPVDTVLSYCRYNLLFSDMDELLTPLAAAQGLGLINASPMAMGLLTPKGPPAWHPAGAKVRHAAARVKDICRAHSADVATVALQFCLQHTYVSSTVVGMSTVSEVQTNLAAAEAPMDATLVAEIRNAVESEWLRPWTSGAPENQDAVSQS